MKDIELAENYVKKECCPNCVNQYECVKKPIDCHYADGYLAGLKAGRPQWHKVTDDLPDDERYVWTNKGPAYYDYDYDCQCWRDEFGRLNRVIAWCEPKYEE